jgi:hypothetical protein
MAHVPLPSCAPQAQKVFESTSIGRSTISTNLASYKERLTGIRLDIVLDGPSGMSTEFTINSHRVVFRLVKDVDLVLVTKPHLLSAPCPTRKRRETYHLSRDTSITNTLE